MTNEEVDRLRALLADGRAAGPCPPADLLARVATGEARPGERDRVVDHLEACAACSEEYRVASALMPWAEQAVSAVGAPGSPKLARSWRTFGYAAAAVLLVAVSVGLLAWALSLQNENARLTATLQDPNRAPGTSPREEAGRERAEIAELQAKLNEALAPALNVPIIDLLPIDAVRGSGSQSVPRVPSTARLVTLVMTTASAPADGAHELEIVDSTGAVVWRGAGLRPNRDRAFTVTVPRSLFAPGTSRVRLRAAGRLMAEYSVVVEP